MEQNIDEQLTQLVGNIIVSDFASDLARLSYFAERKIPPPLEVMIRCKTDYFYYEPWINEWTTTEEITLHVMNKVKGTLRAHM